MKTVKQLGALVKKDHPEYLDLADEEAGRAVKLQYPGQYDDFVDISDKALSVLTHYDPKIGRLRSWWRALKSEGRNKLQAQLTPELLSIIGQGVTLEDAALNSKRKQAEFEAFLIQNQYLLFELQQKANLLEQATVRGMTVPDWSEHNKLELKAERISRRDEEKIRLRIQEEEAISRIRLAEEQQRRTIDLEVRRMEYQQDQDNVDKIESAQSEFEERERQRLNKMYEEREELLRSSNPADKHKLKALEASIQKKEAKLFG